MIKGIDTVFVWVADLDSSVGWYKKLGINSGPRYGDWQTMQVPGRTSFALHQGSGGHDSVNAVISFEVDDLPSELARLSSVGVEPRGGLTNTGQKVVASFVDPDGNEIQLIQPL